MGQVGLVGLELQFFPQNGPDISKAHPHHLHHVLDVGFWVCFKKNPHSLNILRNQRRSPYKNLRADGGNFKKIVNDPFESSQVRNFSRVFREELVPKSVRFFTSPYLRMMNLLSSVEKVESLRKANFAW